MAQSLDIETEVALRIRRAVCSSHLVGAIWSELYRLDRDRVIKLRVAGIDESALPRGISASAQTWLNAAAGSVFLLRKRIATWAKRRRNRLELLDYRAQDHRAAADMGTTRADATNWAQQPFWRP